MDLQVGLDQPLLAICSFAIVSSLSKMHEYCEWMMSVETRGSSP